MADILTNEQVAEFFEKHKVFFQDSYRLNAGSQMWAPPGSRRSGARFSHWRNRYQGFTHWAQQLDDADKAVLTQFTDDLKRILIEETDIHHSEVRISMRQQYLMAVDDSVIPPHMKYLINAIEEGHVTDLLNLKGTSALSDYLSQNITKLTPIIAKWNAYQQERQAAYEDFEVYEKKRRADYFKREDKALVDKFVFLRDVKRAHGQRGLERYLKLLVPSQHERKRIRERQLSDLRTRAEHVLKEEALTNLFGSLSIKEGETVGASSDFTQQDVEERMFHLYLADLLLAKGKITVKDTASDQDLIDASNRYFHVNYAAYRQYFAKARLAFDSLSQPEDDAMAFIEEHLSDEHCEQNDDKFRQYIKTVIRRVPQTTKFYSDDRLENPFIAASPQDRYNKDAAGLISVKVFDTVEPVMVLVKQLELDMQTLSEMKVDDTPNSAYQTTKARIQMLNRKLFGTNDIAKSKKRTLKKVLVRKRHHDEIGTLSSPDESLEVDALLQQEKKRKIVKVPAKSRDPQDKAKLLTRASANTKTRRVTRRKSIHSRRTSATRHKSIRTDKRGSRYNAK